ncbi:hypothetical protein TNCV_4115301, partial [Trichonephila clavipes]
HVAHHMTSKSVNSRLREIGSLTRATMNRQRTMRTPGNEEAVLLLEEDNPNTSSRER